MYTADFFHKKVQATIFFPMTFANYRDDRFGKILLDIDRNHIGIALVLIRYSEFFFHGPYAFLVFVSREHFSSRHECSHISAFQLPYVLFAQIGGRFENTFVEQRLAHFLHRIPNQRFESKDRSLDHGSFKEAHLFLFHHVREHVLNSPVDFLGRQINNPVVLLKIAESCFHWLEGGIPLSHFLFFPGC